jgi:hypothetical protein
MDFKNKYSKVNLAVFSEDQKYFALNIENSIIIYEKAN